jgi:hypothetical protein
MNALNELSQQKYDELVKKFEANTKCVKEIKADLDYVFKKIRQARYRFYFTRILYAVPCVLAATILYIDIVGAHNLIVLIFKLCRTLKAKVFSMHPEQFAEVKKKFPDSEEEEQS